MADELDTPEPVAFPTYQPSADTPSPTASRIFEDVGADFELAATIMGPTNSTLVCVDIPMSWNDANEYCAQTYGGTLVTIRNELSNQWLLAEGEFSQTLPYFWGGRCSWIGYTAQGDEYRGSVAGRRGNWTWASADETEFEGWSGDEPNNCQGSVTGAEGFETSCTIEVGNNEEDCAEACSDLGGGWNDQNCAGEKPFCCETGWWAACDETQPCPDGYSCNTEGFSPASEASGRRKLLFGHLAYRVETQPEIGETGEAGTGCCVST